MGDSPQGDPLSALIGLLLMGAMLLAGYATISSFFSSEEQTTPTEQGAN